MVVLVFVVPLALYLLVLASFNRRSRALVVPGVWDFALLLFGLSGFAVVVGPAVITLLHERWAQTWLSDPDLMPPPTAEGILSGWNLLYLLYFLLVVGASALGLWLRRRQTAVYNIDAEGFALALTSALRQLQTPFAQEGNVVVLGKPARARLTVDVAPLLRHVTLTWEQADEPLRVSVEGELSRELEQVVAADSPLAWFLLAAAAGLLMVALAALVAWALVLFTVGG